MDGMIRYRVMPDNDLMQIYEGEEVGPLGVRLSPDTAQLFASAPEMKDRIAALESALDGQEWECERLTDQIAEKCGCCAQKEELHRQISGVESALAAVRDETARLHLLYDTCAHCTGILQEPTDPPHCMDCILTEEDEEEWKDKVDETRAVLADADGNNANPEQHERWMRVIRDLPGKWDELIRAKLVSLRDDPGRIGLCAESSKCKSCCSGDDVVEGPECRLGCLRYWENACDTLHTSQTNTARVKRVRDVLMHHFAGHGLDWDAVALAVLAAADNKEKS